MHHVSRKDINKAFGKDAFLGYKEFFLTAKQTETGWVFPLHAKRDGQVVRLVNLYSKKKIRQLTGYDP